MNKLAVLCVGAVAAAGALALAGGGAAKPERVGYFKSAAGNRVMAYVAPDGMTEKQARDTLSGLMHTPGRLTFAVIYEPGRKHPGSRLTGASDYFTAAAMLDQPPFDNWTWGAVVNIAGHVQLQEK
ncbi:hypothetical protein [Leisingera sp. S232]|uniref:hypothetical protein n=1 Tax=Leisingera sp. S232 TaxID=3415132 RepID=UPI003C7C3602